MSGWTIRALHHMSFRVSPNHGPRSDAEREGERGIIRSLNRKEALAAKAVSMWVAREIPLSPLARLEARSE
jgi:hypothetical protein